jgi:hypothetical protein
MELAELEETIDDLAADDPLWALRTVPQWLTPYRLDVCAVAEPAAALLYAADRLTPERRVWCEQHALNIKRYIPDRLERERRRAIGLGDGSTME